MMFTDSAILREDARTMRKHGDLALCIMETLSNFWKQCFVPGK